MDALRRLIHRSLPYTHVEPHLPPSLISPHLPGGVRWWVDGRAEGERRWFSLRCSRSWGSSRSSPSRPSDSSSKLSPNSVFAVDPKAQYRRSVRRGSLPYLLNTSSVKPCAYRTKRSGMEVGSNEEAGSDCLPCHRSRAFCSFNRRCRPSTCVGGGIRVLRRMVWQYCRDVHNPRG
jgi:hypothetical protein